MSEKHGKWKKWMSIWAIYTHPSLIVKWKFWKNCMKKSFPVSMLSCKQHKSLPSSIGTLRSAIREKEELQVDAPLQLDLLRHRGA